MSEISKFWRREPASNEAEAEDISLLSPQSAMFAYSGTLHFVAESLLLAIECTANTMKVMKETVTIKVAMNILGSGCEVH